MTPYFALNINKVVAFLTPRFFDKIMYYVQLDDQFNPIQYKLGAIVWYNGLLYRSTEDENITVPTGSNSKWVLSERPGVFEIDVGTCIQTAQNDFYAMIPQTTDPADPSKFVNPDATDSAVLDKLPAGFTNAQLAFMYLTGYWLIERDFVLINPRADQGREKQASSIDSTVFTTESTFQLQSRYTSNKLGLLYLQIMAPIIAIGKTVPTQTNLSISPSNDPTFGWHC